jgi:hypothetical protein
VYDVVDEYPEVAAGGVYAVVDEYPEVAAGAAV